MREDQFQIIVDLLKMIEYNTSVVRLEIEKKVPLSLSFSAPSNTLPASTEVVEAIQKDFFLKLNAKTGWGRNELKHLFIKSKENLIGRVDSLSDNNDEECPF